LRNTRLTLLLVDPPGYEDDIDDIFDEENPSSGGTTSGRSTEKGLAAKIRRKMHKRRKIQMRHAMSIEPGRRQFKIPARVADGKHYVTDELTELTQTFNEMTDELLKQYTSLDEKVAERTRELEISKKAAEAANESKTLFIANISHELKTPLNGIMGMCAVCMEDDDVDRIKKSLKTVYKSGDLLLHLLEDLLSFSKNQIGQQVSLEEREFRLGDIRSQIVAIFDKQVRESKIGFSVNFVSTDSFDASPAPDRRASVDKKLPALGPPGAGRLRDMCLWGDQHRILQVIINLVSNSLKFTPAGGNVDLKIRCVGEVEQQSDESRTSSFSKTGSNRVGRTRHRMGSGSTNSASSKGVHLVNGGTALSINPLEPKPTPHIHIWERSPTPPPLNAKTYLFEFAVEDTGPGIPESMQEKIFEPFVQGDLGLSKKYGGTGLGLSICAQLASLMGGSISLASTPGVGTTFRMQIPLKFVKDR
jgi:osomolarity two-component system sensor histidine kinase SLN1